jgi:trans-aconitate methyltransferase
MAEGPQNVLDVGTGTGEWTNLFIEKYPSAIVEALDISPNVMPTQVDPNCTFEVCDVEDDQWMGRDFDYIHVRLLHGLRDWHRFITNAFEALKPGGHIEIKEFEFPLQFHDPDTAKDSALMTWLTNVIKGAIGY